MIYSSGGGAAEAKDLGALAALNQALAPQAACDLRCSI